jgi:hypothetical protein
MRASLAFAALSLLSACPNSAPRANGRATSDPQTQPAPGELDKKPPEKERTFETELQAVLRAWAEHDARTVRAVAVDSTRPALARSYAFYLIALSQKEADWGRFLDSYPTDPAALDWLAFDSTKGAFSKQELEKACGKEIDKCGPAYMIDQLIELAESGDASAVNAFVGSWLTRTDGGNGQWVCRSLVPRLFRGPERTIRALIGRSSLTPKGREALLGCVDYSLAGNVVGKEIDAIEHLSFSEPAASALTAEIVRHLRNPNPDWP